jgi:hypothetical protein
MPQISESVTDARRTFMPTTGMTDTLVVNTIAGLPFMRRSRKGALVKIGDKVTLRPELMRLHDDAGYSSSYKYKSGIVTYCGSWNIIGVKFIGIDHPIYVREDELQML